MTDKELKELLSWAEVYSPDLYNAYQDKVANYNGVKGRGGWYEGSEKIAYNEMQSALENLKKAQEEYSQTHDIAQEKKDDFTKLMEEAGISDNISDTDDEILRWAWENDKDGNGVELVKRYIQYVKAIKAIEDDPNINNGFAGLAEAMRKDNEYLLEGWRKERQEAEEAAKIKEAEEAKQRESQAVEDEANKMIESGATQSEMDLGGNEAGTYGSKKQLAEVQKAMSDSADAAQQEAYNNYVQNATSGINRSRAGLLADQDTDTTQNVQANYNANRQLGTSTQNDYLQKMQQAKSYEQQANNMKAGSFLNTMSGLLQGASSGAALGATI